MSEEGGLERVIGLERVCVRVYVFKGWLVC